MELIPFLDTDLKFHDGFYIQALDFCLNHCESKKCTSYYESISKKQGFFTCPHGMSSYVDENGNIFSGFRERTTYQKNIAKNISSNNEKKYNPILDKEELTRLSAASLIIGTASKELNNKISEVESLAHEVKSLNSQIKEHCDLILHTHQLDNDLTVIKGEELSNLLEEIQTIFLSSSMISSRYLLLDYEKNPKAIMQGAYFDCTVYRKFDKIRRIFKNYLKKNVPIFINGTTFKNIKAYPSFELIPLLLIDNAVKYTYLKNSVNIDFAVNNNKMLIDICSYGPYCSKDECNHIFEKGFRGKNAKKISNGSGIGLYFVKLLCDVHQIGIYAESDSSKITEINGIAYAPFKIRLTLSNIYDV